MSALQWSHGDVAMEITLMSDVDEVLHRPSMEPWRCSHGDSLSRSRMVITLLCLQWSHGDVAMEISSDVIPTRCGSSTAFNGAMAM